MKSLLKMGPICVCVLSGLLGCDASQEAASERAEDFRSPAHVTPLGSDVLQYVDPFVGTGGHGHTFPGAVVPFGMVQLSPDNVSKGWDWTSGYNYSSKELIGFSHTHLSGTGVGDLLDILVMPFRGDYPKRRENGGGYVASKYSHEDESAEPGYYRVALPDDDIVAELTATERTGVHRYQFNGSTPGQLLFDLGYAQNYDKTVATLLRVEDNQTIWGYRISSGWSKFQPVYFYARFNRPFRHQLYQEGKAIDGSIIQGEAGRVAEVVLTFDNPSDPDVVAKVGISYVSIKGAKENLDTEVSHFDFDQVRKEAKQKWAAQLNKFRVSDASTENKTKFYTALYHSHLAPQIFNDVSGAFLGADGAAHYDEDYQRYSLFSLWDTFRALHPLFTISESDRVNDMVKSMLGFYDEVAVLPSWDLMSNENDVMIGYHAVPVIIDAYLKGLTDADPEKIFRAARASATQRRFGIELIDEYGYLPSELEGESVSKTLEYAFDDWAIARLAQSLDKQDAYQYFSKRAASFNALFDPETGFFRGKDSAGNWVQNFDPLHVKHRGSDYTEANAWHYLWFVPHDVPRLIELLGGEAAFIEKLDALFETSSKMEGDDISPDISGLIGQYAHGNEPCHHVPYLYAFTSQKWKGEARLKQIRETMYGITPEGLSGNDDLGQMSAWYVFSALGFYPLNPASGTYVLGTPEFEQVEVQLPNNKVFTIRKNSDSGDGYVTRVELNGTVLGEHQIDHQSIMNGGILEFYLDSTVD